MQFTACSFAQHIPAHFIVQYSFRSEAHFCHDEWNRKGRLVSWIRRHPRINIKHALPSVPQKGILLCSILDSCPALQRIVPSPAVVRLATSYLVYNISSLYCTEHCTCTAGGLSLGQVLIIREAETREHWNKKFEPEVGEVVTIN